jgi:hypothetical protein
MRCILSVGLLITGFMFPALAAAETGAPDSSGGAAPREGGGLLAGAKIGGIVPFGGLSPNAAVGIEIGYVFPWLHRSLAAAIDLDYAQPTASGTESDPRVAAGKYSWHLTEQQLNLMPVVMYRLTSLGRLTPFAGIGPRIYFLKSTVSSDGAQPKISDTTEQSTAVGVGVPLGLEFQLGPGGLLAELLLQYGGLDHTATGESNTGALSFSLGYRLLL